jgi:hypothetical protein
MRSDWHVPAIANSIYEILELIVLPSAFVVILPQNNLHHGGEPLDRFAQKIEVIGVG